jgi:hypothetical protein
MIQSPDLAFTVKRQWDGKVRIEDHVASGENWQLTG